VAVLVMVFLLESAIQLVSILFVKSFERRTFLFSGGGALRFRGRDEGWGFHLMKKLLESLRVTGLGALFIYSCSGCF